MMELKKKKKKTAQISNVMQHIEMGDYAEAKCVLFHIGQL